MVAGPTAGLILADLGADVIKIEPKPDGDKTRTLERAGAGFFPTFNRNKRSMLLNLKSAEDKATVLELIATSDVVLENFRPGAMDALGLGADALTATYPRLVYASVKGFLSGPYEHRAALDEVVQMMAGLAYMTGLPGRPLRAGSSVNDIMGGMFAVIAILAALRERDRTGKGQKVASGLFENCTLLVAQHMTQFSLTGRAPPPMAIREPAWGVYDIFDCADGQLFVGAVTDTQWQLFCDGFGLTELSTDPRLSTNQKRVYEREWLIPRLAAALKTYKRKDLESKVAALGLPYAPITKPEELINDPHLNAADGLLATTMPDGRTIPVPSLPMEMANRRFKLRRHPPKPGEHNAEIIASLKAKR